MLTKVFTVRDAKSKAFFTPFFLPNEETALRAISDCVNDDTHGFSRHPEDYSVYILGEYDDETGKFTLLDAPEHLASCVTLL